MKKKPQGYIVVWSGSILSPIINPFHSDFETPAPRERKKWMTKQKWVYNQRKRVFLKVDTKVQRYVSIITDNVDATNRIQNSGFQMSAHILA